MTRFKKIILGCVAAALLFIAGCFIRGYYVNRHFERGSAQVYGVVTSSVKKHHPARHYRVRHRPVHQEAYDEYIIRYTYTVPGAGTFDGEHSSRHNAMPRRPVKGDSILVTYALDDPSLSRTGSTPKIKRSSLRHKVVR